MANNPHKQGGPNGRVGPVEIEAPAADQKFEPTQSGSGGAWRASRALAEPFVASTY